MAPQHGQDRPEHRRALAAPEATALRLALPHDLRIQPDARVVEEEAPVHFAHIDADLVIGGDRLRGLLERQGNAHVPGEVVERPQRQDSQRGAGPGHDRCDGVHGAVAAGRDEGLGLRVRFLAREIDEIGSLAADNDAHADAGGGKGFLDLLQPVVVARSRGGVDDHGDRGALQAARRLFEYVRTPHRHNTSHAVLMLMAARTSLR